MILLVAGSLALLVVYAGVKLLLQTQKETLGNMYRCFSWFFIIAGFLILASAGACCIAMCCKYGARMMNKEHKMMEEYHEGEHGYMGYKEHKKMMKYGHHMGGEGCSIYINCNEEDMEKCTNTNMCKTDSICKRK